MTKYKRFGTNYSNKRKNYNQWIHAYPKDDVTETTTLCGKTARRIVRSKYNEKVTCPRCLKEIENDR